jgi:anti-anti-sigma factor
MIQQMLNIRDERIGRHRIVHLSGSLDRLTIHNLQDHVERLIKEEPEHLLCDCRELRYMNSSAAGVLLSYRKWFRSRGGTFVLCGLQPRIQESLDALGILRIIETEPSIEDALQTATD